MSNSAETPKAQVILQGAMQEFLKQGYAGTSMDRVATAAGVSKATVYSYFQDKESLFTALIEHLGQQKLQPVFTTVTFDQEPEMVLRKLATQGLQQMLGDPEYFDFIRLLIGESGRFPHLSQLFLRNFAKPAITFLSQYFIQHPELKIIHPEVTARIFIGSLVYFTLTQKILQGEEVMPMAQAELIEGLVTLILGNR
jgi:AcrR family transcriptional regulator